MQQVCTSKSFIPRSMNVWFLGTLGFQATYRIQQLIASKHHVNVSSTHTHTLDTVLMVEHPPVYTTGIREACYPDSLQEKFKKIGAEFQRTNRGGLITFHGPGQLVVYPILNLKNYTKSMRCYIDKLEEAVIKTCRLTYGIEAERSKDTGVWVKDNKLCAIGVHGSRYITTHGLALNCNVDLDWFKHIVPCGIADKGVTSLSMLLGNEVTVQNALPAFLRSFSAEFQGTLQAVPKQLQAEAVDALAREGMISSVEIKQLLEDQSNLFS